MALLPAAEALARILDGVKPTATEIVPLAQAQNRILAKPVLAKRDQPPFQSSAMDGYAVRAGDSPVLKVAGTSQAGAGYRGTLKPGTAIRIFTGAPVPKGADAVLIQENAKREDDRITVLEPVSPNQNIRRKGLDFAKGDVLIEAGTRLTARHMMLAAAANCAELSVRARPRVAILSTGDELVAPGEKPGSDQIVSSNSTGLAALIHQCGGEPVELGIVPDNLTKIRRAIRKAEGCDVLLTTGGASVGEHDLVQAALDAEGIKLSFWKIAMRPGKPLMFARKARQRILGLPGNPVSAFVCARLFLKPLLDSLLGLNAAEAPSKALLAAPLKANGDRQDYIRARLARGADGRLTAEPFATQDSSMQRLLSQANGLIIRPPFTPASDAGATVDVLELDP
jgi:molybdopterin molybdotransferase